MLSLNLIVAFLASSCVSGMVLKSSNEFSTSAFEKLSPLARVVYIVDAEGDRGFDIVNQLDDSEDVLATASFHDRMLLNGWGELRVRTSQSSESSEWKKAFAAGVSEGFLTANHIYDHVMNMYGITYGKETKMPKEVQDWMSKQIKWVDTQIKKNPDDSFWIQVDILNAQVLGLYEGYKRANLTRKSLSFLDLYFVNSIGDLLDLHVAANHTKTPKWDDLSAEAFDFLVQTTTHCSGLIRATADLSDIIFSHSSWFSYSSMNRIFKHYDFDLKVKKGIKAPAASRVSFSSYPGMLSSLDDFYMMSSDLAMIQTTNNVFTDLSDLVHPESLLAWQRVRLACRIANSGKEWASIIDTYNSGTYNNQYMVIDFKKFEKGVALHDGTLWVVEQIPGLVEATDQTIVLRDGHWPSYNVPFHKTIYQKSGYPEIVKKRGPQYGYQMAPRATIFRRDAGNVHNIDDMKNIMRYNDYQNDPLSKHDPSGAICSRYDLKEGQAINSGCYDTKVSNFEMFKKMRAFAINGPTTGNGNLPVFSWAGKLKDEPHFGMPVIFDFAFVEVDPQWESFPFSHPL